MKTKVDAAKILSNAGWNGPEIRAVLGNVPGIVNGTESQSDSPWWIWVEKGYTADPPTVPEWEAWVGLD